jgi:hypothetical protein
MKSFLKVQKRTKKNFMKALRAFVKRKQSKDKQSKKRTIKVARVKP